MYIDNRKIVGVKWIAQYHRYPDDIGGFFKQNKCIKYSNASIFSMKLALVLLRVSQGFPGLLKTVKADHMTTSVP